MINQEDGSSDNDNIYVASDDDNEDQPDELEKASVSKCSNFCSYMD